MYGNSTAATYGLNRPARCIAALQGDSEHHRFLCGTASVKEDNEVRTTEGDVTHTLYMNEKTCYMETYDTHHFLLQSFLLSLSHSLPPSLTLDPPDRVP